MEVLLRLSGLLALLLIGTGLRRGGVLNRRRTSTLNTVAYYGALPALVFTATYDRNVVAILTPELFVGVLGVFALTVALAWLVTRRRSNPARRSVTMVQSYHSNLGYLGLPLVDATFGSEVTAVASVVLGIGSLIQVPITVLLLVTTTGVTTQLRSQFLQLGKNPVLIALVAGIAVGSLQPTVPTVSTVVPDVLAALAPVSTVVLEALATLALPLALVCVGASLEVDGPTLDFGATGSVVGLKLIAMPVIAWAIFSTLGINGAAFTAGIVMFGTPTAVSTYVFATELGGDEQFASLNVFVTTLVTLASMFVLIRLVS